MRGARRTVWSALGGALGFGLVALLVAPLGLMAWSTSAADVSAGVAHPMFWPALGLSVRTTLLSLVCAVVAGTPLAWWLARSPGRLARAVEVAVELPIVVPPAVVGVALLGTFGRQGVFGPALEPLGIGLPFTQAAVVVAQVVVAAPFYVQAAAAAFREVDEDTMLVARTLGASPELAFARVAWPMAWPGLVAGASLCWARALGEFGATLLFAGNMTGRTQTMPLAIFTALESDVRLAVVFSLLLAAVGAALLVGLRLWGARRRSA